MKYNYSEIKNVMELIKNNLTPDLLLTKHREKNRNNPMYGHCVHASHALLLLIDTDRLVLMSGGNHMWVQDGEKIYDITCNQYSILNLDPPYSKGKPHGNLKPSLRTLELVKRVQCAS
jgi:hypothetical protein